MSVLVLHKPTSSSFGTPLWSLLIQIYICVWVCVSVRARVCVCACACVWVLGRYGWRRAGNVGVLWYRE